MSLTLECPHCQSCYDTEDWNKSPHRGDSIPETIFTSEEFDEWNKTTGGSQFDCPDCGEVAITEDMTVV